MTKTIDEMQKVLNDSGVHLFEIVEEDRGLCKLYCDEKPSQDTMDKLNLCFRGPAFLEYAGKCSKHEMEPNTTMNFMFCRNCNEGLEEGLANMPEEPSDLYS